MCLGYILNECVIFYLASCNDVIVLGYSIYSALFNSIVWVTVFHLASFNGIVFGLHFGEYVIIRLTLHIRGLFGNIDRICIQ